jgi:hypothetical protein
VTYFKFGLRLTVAFFIVGTIILVLFFLDSSKSQALIAYQFTIMAIVVNWLYALYLLFLLLRRRISIPMLVKTLSVMAINIPVGILYSYLMIWILSFARVTIENKTGALIPEIELNGCEKKVLNNLENGESETIWIKIKTECDVNLSYHTSSQNRNETIVSKLSPGKGLQIKYELQ